MRESVGKFRRIWCGVMHDAPMWPVHGKYEWRRCGQRHTVAWAIPELTPARRLNHGIVSIPTGDAFAPLALRKRTA